ncbi:P-loop containing nucleoside triphosphate hydrolase protein [Mycena vulgaris]|nr:P-loop containing nucleoside triphosphate hydrolase protein [Mycena vulgaris]
MHKYFTEDVGKQHIFLLHGLGGAGKTQIGLKFVESSLSLFSDRFFIDTSTLGTIDTGLKSIATAKNAGNTAQDALQWLKNNEKWLFFFDNADDQKFNTDELKDNADGPKLTLNVFLRQCNNGNIVITSRNPGLHVYAEEQFLVSDMEGADAVKLLLRSAAERITPKSEKLAAAIVKELYCFPLAIIQAGAFISESRDLDSYLTLYSENRVQLLSEKPAHQHDDYAWTVYTTWQMSFEKLSPPAAQFLQLCSLIHHAVISEDIFKNASIYSFPEGGPQKNELQMPLGFLSHFLETGAWQPVKFLKMTNEIKRYSLISFDSEKKMFSIHPLVHTWSQSTLTDPKLFHECMVGIVGMSFTMIPDEHRMLAALKLLPHVQLLLKGNTTVTPDFSLSYRRIYSAAGRWKEAEHLQLEIHERTRKKNGDDHQSTLSSMAWLAFIYHHLGKLEEAENLELIVMEKKISLLGDDHPHTMSTYSRLGKLEEAEKLCTLVLKKGRQLLGEDHPDTVKAMTHLAHIYHSQSEFAEAEKLKVVVLEKRSRILGEDDPDTVTAMAELAATYHCQGEFAEAEKRN